jgi:hypothetical protein
MIKPKELDKNDKLYSCFGKLEMEVTARKIILLAQEDDSWDVPLKSEMFPEDMENEGFHDLIEYGWFHRKGNVYYVRDAFVARLEKYKNKEF